LWPGSAGELRQEKIAEIRREIEKIVATARDRHLARDVGDIVGEIRREEDKEQS